MGRSVGRAIGVALVSVLLAGCGPASSGASPTFSTAPPQTPASTGQITPGVPPTPTTAPALNLPPGRPVASTAVIDLELTSHVVVATDDAVWVAGGGTAQRIDPETNEAGTPVALEAGYDGFGMTFGFGSLWVAAFDTGKVARMDADTGELIEEIEVGGATENLLAAFGSVWVSRHREQTVGRIDPETNTVVALVQVGAFGPGGPAGLVATPEKVWVAIPNTSALIGIDPETNKGSGSVKIAGSFPCGVAYAAARLWSIACFDAARQLDVFDPVAGQHLGSVPIDGLVLGAGEINGRVWVPTADRFPPPPGPGRILGFDPDTLEVTDLVEPEATGGGIVAFGSLWLADEAGARLLRIDVADF